MYARQVRGETITLGVSGMLWQESLVMYDVGTESLWSHLLGEAMAGPLVGEKLRQLPSQITTWRSFREQHADGSVVLMSKMAYEFDRHVFKNKENYYALGIARGNEAKHWVIAGFLESPVVDDTWQGEPVVAAYDAASGTARLYARKLGDRLLSFEWTDGMLEDRQTGSRWQLGTGRAVSGELAGNTLTPLPAFLTFTRAWYRFHPRSVAWPAGSEVGNPAEHFAPLLLGPATEQQE